MCDLWAVLARAALSSSLVAVMARPQPARCMQCTSRAVFRASAIPECSLPSNSSPTSLHHRVVVVCFVQAWFSIPRTFHLRALLRPRGRRL